MNRPNYLYITGLAFKLGVLFFIKEYVYFFLYYCLLFLQNCINSLFGDHICVLLSTAGKNKANLEKFFKSFKKVQLMSKGLWHKRIKISRSWWQLPEPGKTQIILCYFSIKKVKMCSSVPTKATKYFRIPWSLT